MKKKSDSAYDSVAYNVSSDNYKVVTLVRRSDRSIFHNMPQCLGPSIAIGLFLSFSLHCIRRSRKAESEDKNVPILGTPIAPFKSMKPFTTLSTSGQSPWLVKISQTWANFVQTGKKVTCSNTTKRFFFCNILFF